MERSASLKNLLKVRWNIRKNATPSQPRARNLGCYGNMKASWILPPAIGANLCFQEAARELQLTDLQNSRFSLTFQIRRRTVNVESARILLLHRSSCHMIIGDSCLIYQTSLAHPGFKPSCLGKSDTSGILILWFIAYQNLIHKEYPS